MRAHRRERTDKTISPVHSRAFLGTTRRTFAIRPISTFVTGADKRFGNKSFSPLDARERAALPSYKPINPIGRICEGSRVLHREKPCVTRTNASIHTRRHTHVRKARLRGTLSGPRSASSRRTRIPGEYPNKEKRGRQQGRRAARGWGRKGGLAEVRATPQGL